MSQSTSQKTSFSDNKAKQENAVGAREALSCLSKWARQSSRHSDEEMGIFVKNIQEFHFRRQKRRRGQRGVPKIVWHVNYKLRKLLLVGDAERFAF